MSTHQLTNPRRANQSITEESGRPGTARSNVGCDAIDEPCTNSTAGFPSGESTYFSHKNRRTSPLCAQCPTPVTGAPAANACVVIAVPLRRCQSGRSIDFSASFPDDLRPSLFFHPKERAELGRCRAHDLDAGGGHVAFYFTRGKRLEQFAVQFFDDGWRRAFRCQQAHPDIRLVSGNAGFHHGWHI